MTDPEVKPSSPTLGLSFAEGAYSEILREMLDHQGVSYDDSTKASARYPIVLSIGDGTENRNREEEFRAHGGVVIHADAVLDMERIRGLLSGEVENRRDNFDAYINDQEGLLLAEVKKGLAELRLPLIQKWYWPEFAKAGCVLTHDLDWLVFSPMHRVAMRGPRSFLRQPVLLYKRVARKAKFGWNVPETIDAESTAGFRSSFFIKTKYEQAEQRLLGDTLRVLKESRADVGLHAAGASYRKEESLRKEVDEFREMFGRPPTGIRQHILKFEAPRSWELQTSCGMEYDATFSFNEYFGFRAGVCYPYRPISGEKRLPITELPTSFMDWTFLHRRYGRKRAGDALRKVIRTVEMHHGLLLVNFHNTYLDREVFPDIWAMYCDLLRYLKKEQYWVGTAAECVSWWTRRQRAGHPDDHGDTVPNSPALPFVVHDAGKMFRLRQ